jgi:hypothetical protein
MAGTFSLALGIVHIAIPAIVRYRLAIGPDRGATRLGDLRLGRIRYALRRSDLVGLTWVMSNAASYVLISIGLVDLTWTAGSSPVPRVPLALWIAGWWVLRGAGQLIVGRRAGDWLIAAGFVTLGAVHVVLATAT